MPRYIDADLIEYKAICVPMLDGMFVRAKQLDGFYAIEKDIEAIPTAYVQEVRHGRWELIGKNVIKCTACGFARNIKTQFGWSFCQNCGCKLDNSGDV